MAMEVVYSVVEVEAVYSVIVDWVVVGKRVGVEVVY